MNRRLMRPVLLLTLMCALFGSVAGVRGQALTPPEPSERETRLSQYDGLTRAVAEERQRLLESAFELAPVGHRFGASRSERLVPSGSSHGGGNTACGSGSCRGTAWLSKDYLSNLYKYACLCLLRDGVTSAAGQTSPRYYYVIALRRILC